MILTPFTSNTVHRGGIFRGKQIFILWGDFAAISALRRARRPRRALLQGSALRGGFLFHVEKEPKDARGWGQSDSAAPHPPCAPPPRTPVTGGYPFGLALDFRRTKSEWHFKFPPGQWALALQKLPLLRSRSCAWLFSANAPGPSPAVGAAHRAARFERLPPTLLSVRLL